MTTYEPQIEARMGAAASIARLAQASSLIEMEEVARTEFARLGCELTVGALVHREPGATQKVDIIFGDKDHPWIEHYNNENLGQVCPITGSANPRPLSWREIKSRPLSPEQRGVFDQLGAFSLFDGHIISIEGFGTTSAVISTGGRYVNFDDPETRVAAHLLSVNYGLLAMSHWSAQRNFAMPPAIKLTSRQLDCLKWALEGKSSSDIADILGLSQRTVDEHFERACATLGVRTRLQACIQAARMGLLTF